MNFEKNIFIYFPESLDRDQKDYWRKCIKDYYSANGGEVDSIDEKEGSWIVEVTGYVSSSPTASFFIGSVVSGAIGWGVSKLADQALSKPECQGSLEKQQETTGSNEVCAMDGIGLTPLYSANNEAFRSMYISERTVISNENGVRTYQEKALVSKEDGFKEYMCMSSDIKDMDSFREHIISENFPDLARIRNR